MLIEPSLGRRIKMDFICKVANFNFTVVNQLEAMVGAESSEHGVDLFLLSVAGGHLCDKKGGDIHPCNSILFALLH